VGATTPGILAHVNTDLIIVTHLIAEPCKGIIQPRRSGNIFAFPLNERYESPKVEQVTMKNLVNNTMH
jgi:hypothetical protein